MQIMNRSLFLADEPRVSMVDMVVEKIKTLLIERKLKPGDMLPSETVLAESLKVSRGSIREAMKILSAFGIIEIRRGDGTYISTAGNQKIFSPLLFRILVEATDYQELIELRSMMEKGIVSLIIHNARDDEIEELHQALRAMEEAAKKDHDGHAERDKADLNFHRTMGKLTKNSMVSNIYGFVMELFAPTINATYGLMEHRLLYEAIKRRDTAEAVRIIEKHTRIWCKVNNIKYDPDSSQDT
jgi:DNA-binding FadR family transcriptional regulator